MHSQDFLSKVAARDAVVGIVGLGYVGLPLALTFAEREFSVIGFDIDQNKVDNLLSGASFIGHIPSQRIQRATENHHLTATTDPTLLQQADAILITVPTPLAASGDPDLRFVEATATTISQNLRQGQLVVLESTTYPGTTEEVVKPLLENSGLRAGVDFWVAYSPEREDPGNPDFSTSSIPKVVGGLGTDATEVAAALYRAIVPSVIEVSSPRAAEATKLTENIFRAINIALVNELKLVYEKLGVDIWEVLDAAETKPFGFMRFDPGPGWGGHCIPIDPFYLSWAAERAGASADFIKLAGEINTQMADHVVERLVSALSDRGTSIDDAKVLVLGIAYKPNVDDPRESPAFPIMDQLLRVGAELGYHDPYVPILPPMRSWPEIPAMASRDLSEETVSTVDAVLILTQHANVDYALVERHSQLVVDTRGVYRNNQTEHIIPA